MGSESDATRIASQIIPGIGFIGAGSILHAKTSVTGLTTAATLFVVASVGMAAGGGLYLTACFATAIILFALVLLGRMEVTFSLKAFSTTYEVTGRNVDGMLREINRTLDAEQLTMHSVHIANADPDFRMVFSVDGEHDQQTSVLYEAARIGCLCHRDHARVPWNTNERAAGPEPKCSNPVHQSIRVRQ